MGNAGVVLIMTCMISIKQSSVFATRHASMAPEFAVAPCSTVFTQLLQMFALFLLLNSLRLLPAEAVNVSCCLDNALLSACCHRRDEGTAENCLSMHARRCDPFRLRRKMTQIIAYLLEHIIST
jgi:hypothetical protein